MFFRSRAVIVEPCAASGPPRDRAAERLVVDQLGDRGVLPADRALRVLADLDGAVAHLQGVVDHQPADQRLADPGDDLDGLVDLEEPIDAHSTPRTPPSAQDGTMPGGGGSGYRQR